ncbi:MAG TPA: UDP-N-acetylmuramoyl-tripeptide--D-alanyl-D-alanine ligase, partial [Campylobacter avium]|nr:UDP-N-acetylmuramoyl-tripeptide--D-alanyl-D-alanine ligase [Campylobacter avium]
MNYEYIGLTTAIFALSFALSFYLITALQWYSYKIERICFHFSKPLWHFYFLLLPSLVFAYSYKLFLLLFLPFCLILFIWHKKLDKKLVFTTKVKLFFIFNAFSAFIFALIIKDVDYRFSILSPFLALFILKIYSFFEARYFYKKAKKKIESMKNLKIILITAS